MKPISILETVVCVVVGIGLVFAVTAAAGDLTVDDGTYYGTMPGSLTVERDSPTTEAVTLRLREKCEACRGNGKALIKCPLCGSENQEAASREKSRDGRFLTHYLCRNSGRGCYAAWKKYDEELCLVCSGSGYVWREVEAVIERKKSAPTAVKDTVNTVTLGVITIRPGTSLDCLIGGHDWVEIGHNVDDKGNATGIFRKCWRCGASEYERLPTTNGASRK